MANVDQLIQSKDGPALKLAGDNGDNDARVGFASLVFYRGYQGDPQPGGTKKAAKELAFADALRFVDEACEQDHYPALKFRADLNFHGAFDFGAKVRLHNKQFSVAEEDYTALLAHPDTPPHARGECLIHLAQAMLFRDKIKGKDRKEQALVYLNEATDLAEHRSYAHHILADALWRDGHHEKAVEHALCCYEQFPWAAYILHIAYRHGRGVDSDDGKAKWFHEFWENNTQG